MKLTKAEVQALELLLSQIIKFDHIDMGDKLLICILTAFYKKLVVKLLDLKKTYSIKMDEQTELAFYVYFNGEDYDPTNFTDNLVKKISNNIQKKYA